ncbi:hypothetical protein V7D15_13890, partial [Thermoanaerobacter thermohydrosulfuricus]
ITAGDGDTDWGEAVKKALLSRPAAYTQAARWHTGQFLNASIQAKERVIIEERPAGIVTIEETATAHGIGRTHTVHSKN